MDITYLGDASFLLKSDQSVAINPPQGLEQPRIILHSERQDDKRITVSGPGEYEIAGVLISTVETGESQARTLAHAVRLDNLNVAHLGTQANPLSQTHLETMGKIDILLIAVDDLPPAQKAIVDLAPRVVIPFGSKAAELCQALGIKTITPEAHFSWNGTSKVPKAVLLRVNRPRRRSKAAAAKQNAA